VSQNDDTRRASLRGVAGAGSLANLKRPKTPGRAEPLALVALLFAGLCVFACYGTTRLIRDVLVDLGHYAGWWEFVFAAMIACAAVLFWPAVRAMTYAKRAGAALDRNDVVAARIDIAAARDWSYVTFGWGAFALVALGFIAFLLINDVAVGQTFFYLPLMLEKWPLVVKAFWNNIFIFVVAEILVLVWGLIVAIARLMPGPAGQPIRALAILYCDIFRGLPAIVTLYLVGFGLPLSGLPQLVLEPLANFLAHVGAIEPSQISAFKKLPLTWYCILALTLTYGAYVAEVYRAGIESIHWSQVAAARSLGLSYLQTMRYVVVPQAVRRILAPLLNDFIGLQKDTALVQVIGVIDAFNQSRIIASNAFNLSAVTIVAILFVLVTIPQARFVDKLIERDNARIKAGG
jgi:polar amino acid transport system permease protein